MGKMSYTLEDIEIIKDDLKKIKGDSCKSRLK